MKPAQQELPPARQLVMALDGRRLWEMTPAERSTAVAALARLLLEAADALPKAARNDRG